MTEQMPRSKIPPAPSKTHQEKPVVTKPIPGPAAQTPVPAQTRSGFVDSMVSGFGFGMGSSLARSLFEPKTPSEPRNPTPAPTPDDIFKKYQECVERNEPTINCEMLFNTKSQ